MPVPPPSVMRAQLKSLRESRDRISRGEGTQKDYMRVAQDDVQDWFVFGVIIALLGAIFIGLPVMLMYVHFWLGVIVAAFCWTPWIAPYIVAHSRMRKDKNLGKDSNSEKSQGTKDQV